MYHNYTQKTPQTHSQPTHSGLFGRVFQVLWVCVGYFGLKKQRKTNKKSSHLQSNRLEHHSLQMPLS